MFDKAHFELKKEKLNKKFQVVKDTALQEILNITNRLGNEVNEMNQEMAEVDQALKEIESPEPEADPE